MSTLVNFLLALAASMLTTAKVPMEVKTASKTDLIPCEETLYNWNAYLIQSNNEQFFKIKSNR